jgi:hypothetical protein
MAPTPAQIATSESDCKNYNQTVDAWREMQKKDIVAFNALLAKNHLQELKAAPTALTDVSCTMGATESKKEAKK